MTINTTASRQDYLGDGVSTIFAVPFPFFDQTELRVIERVIATGAETLLVLGSAYTVSGGNGATGSVTALAAPASTKQWTILRNTRRTQEVDYQPNDPFPAETHERALDRVTALVQENERDQARAVRVPETDPTGGLTLPTTAERANHVLAFDAAGDPMASVPNTENLPVTDYTVGFLQAADAAAARQTLGLGLALTLVYPGFLMPSLRPFTPSGWLACYGQAVSRTTYAVLWAALGSPNSGDGSTTFDLPDLRGRSLFGKDDMGGTPANRITNAVSGIAGTTLAAAGGDQRLHQHSHGVTDPGHQHNYATLGGPGVGAGANGWLVGVGGEAQPTQSATTSITVQNAGAGGAQNMPPAMIVNWLIYTGVAA